VQIEVSRGPLSRSLQNVLRPLGLEKGLKPQDIQNMEYSGVEPQESEKRRRSVS